VVLSNEVIPGPCVTVYDTPLLATPPIVTSTGPVVAPNGTTDPIAVPVQLVGLAEAPFSVTVLQQLPKLFPLIANGLPTGPEAGVKLVIWGGEPTVNKSPLL